MSVRIHLVLSAAMLLSFLIGLWAGSAPVEAQGQQPNIYIVGSYRSEEMREPFAIYWFESGTDECYLMVGWNKAGGGISCLRKVQP